MGKKPWILCKCQESQRPLQGSCPERIAASFPALTSCSHPQPSWLLAAISETDFSKHGVANKSRFHHPHNLCKHLLAWKNICLRRPPWLHIFFSESKLAAWLSSQLIVSVLHQNSEIHPQRPRDFLRPERSWVSGNLSAVGDGFPITSRVLVEYGHSLIINISTGSGTGNPSLWEDWQCQNEPFPADDERMSRVTPKRAR